MDVPQHQRTCPKKKFAKSFLIWQAIDELGNVSKPFISDRTMNAEIYLEECVKARLIPFIKEYHSTDKVLFWPVMATCHYASIVTDYLEKANIEFVQKKQNAPNVPQARGIERFWAN